MRAELYLLISVIFWGLNFHFAKYMLAESSYVEAATWRYIFGVGTLLFLGWRSLKKIDLSTISVKGILLIGIIGLFGFNVLFFKGLEYTEAINASLIVSLNPILTIGFSGFMLGTQITPNHVVGAMISLLGVIFLLFQGEVSNIQSLDLNKGDIIIFVGVTVFALHNVWVKQYKGHLSNINFTSLTNAVCLLGFLFLIPFDTNGLQIDHINWYWLWAIGIGTFGTAIAYLFWNRGITMIGPDKAGMFLNVVPFAVAITGVLLGEQLYGYHIVSGLIILSGVLMAQRSS